jgi:hypothetical protein
MPKCDDCGGPMKPTTIDPDTDVFLDGEPDPDEPVYYCPGCGVLEATEAR